MEIYLVVTSFGFIISLCQVLGLGKLIRLRQLKKLYPKATLKDVESFEKNTNPHFFNGLRNKINNPGSLIVTVVVLAFLIIFHIEKLMQFIQDL